MDSTTWNEQPDMEDATKTIDAQEGEMGMTPWHMSFQPVEFSFMDYYYLDPSFGSTSQPWLLSSNSSSSPSPVHWKATAPVSYGPQIERFTTGAMAGPSQITQAPGLFEFSHGTDSLFSKTAGVVSSDDSTTTLFNAEIPLNPPSGSVQQLHCAADTKDTY